MLHVVRSFEDPSLPHPSGSVDPARDLEQLDLEFILADLAMVDRRLERLGSSGRHGTPAERESNEREEVILRRLKSSLEAGHPIRDAGMADVMFSVRPRDEGVLHEPFRHAGRPTRSPCPQKR